MCPKKKQRNWKQPWRQQVALLFWSSALWSTHSRRFCCSCTSLFISVCLFFFNVWKRILRQPGKKNAFRRYYCLLTALCEAVQQRLDFQGAQPEQMAALPFLCSFVCSCLFVNLCSKQATETQAWVLCKSVDHSKVKLSTEGIDVLLGTLLPFLPLRNTRYCMWLSGGCGRVPHINYWTINVIKVNKSRFCPSFVFILVYCFQYGGTHPAIPLLTARGQKITLNGRNLFFLFFSWHINFQMVLIWLLT